MDIDKIAKLIALMQESNLSSLEIEEDNIRVKLAREKEIIAGPGYHHLQHALPAPGEGGGSITTKVEVKEDERTEIIKSPMVGTFYRAPSPESAPFIEEGARVSSETVVCIIEAMKVMNEIQAEVSGTVVEVLVENGVAVEFGQPLFKVRKG